MVRIHLIRQESIRLDISDMCRYVIFMNKKYIELNNYTGGNHGLQMYRRTDEESCRYGSTQQSESPERPEL
jgi:hypothetical protein